MVSMDIKAILEIIPELKKHGIKSFKAGGVAIEFHVEPPKPLSTEDHEVPVDETQLPPDLRADDTMNYDKVLNWSGSPDPNDEGEMPLTGESEIQ